MRKIKLKFLIWDVGGANDVYIANHNDNVEIDGVDIVDGFFTFFDEFADDNIKERVKLRKADFYNLGEEYTGKYAGILSLQTLSWVEDWRKPVDIMCGLKPRWIALSSLFYEGKIDYQIKLKDYEEQGITEDYTQKYYNIYSLPLIKEYLRNKGYDIFKYEPFEIDIDIEKPDSLNVGTYTLKTEKGKRLQISGALLLPWYFVYAARN